MQYFNIREIDSIPKTENSELVVRRETNEFNEEVIDFRIRALQPDGKWKFTKFGITYPLSLHDKAIEVMIKAKEG